MIETILPRDEKHWLELRKQDVTSTEVAALFGLSPYMTHYELWHRKHDNLDVEFEPNERVKWGTRLQDSIALGLLEDQGWAKGRRKFEYLRDTDLRMGASFDWEMFTPEQALLEIKNVDSLVFKEGWIVDGENVEAPPHIELQVQHQLALTGFKVAYIGALIGGNRVVLIKREPDRKIIAAIKKRISEFWASVARHEAPPPDFKRDADFITGLYSHSEPGRIINADERISQLAAAYKQAAAESKAAEDKKDAARAEILTLIGDAERVTGETFTISAGLIGPKLIEAYERKGYRSFKINFKKEKLNADRK